MDYLTMDPKTWQNLQIAEAELVTTKIDIWDRLVQAKFPNFSVEKIINARYSIPGAIIYSTLTTVALSSDPKIVYIWGGNSEVCTYTVNFGTEEIYIKTANGSRSVNFPFVSYDARLELAVKQSGLWSGLVDATKKCSRHCNHDFIHNATARAKIFDDLFKERNRKNLDIDGYEHFSLALHQEIYAELRKFPGEISKVYNAACEYADVIDKFAQLSTDADKEPIVDVLYEFLYFMLRNLVAGKEFCNSEGKFSRIRAKWLEALTTGVKQPYAEFVIIADGIETPISLEGISQQCYRYFCDEIFAKPSLARKP